MPRKGIVLVVVPAVGLALLLAALLASRNVGARFKKSGEPVASPTGTLPRVPKPVPRDAKVKGGTFETAVENLRVETAYTNYRTAVAMGNDYQAKVLLSHLIKDRVTALAYAQRDLERAASDADRDIAQRVIKDLNP